MYYSITNSGLLHSEIPGSTFTYNSPRHIGVSPVLLQLLVPRHSPCALVHLTKLTIIKAFNLMSLIILLLFSFQGTSLREICSLKTEQTTLCFTNKIRVPYVWLNRPNGRLYLSYILRKEVIQPHLPIRLPCYDFTPIIGPTFGGWLQLRLPHRLRVLPTLVL